MNTTFRVLRWTLLAAIVVIIGATLGWYLYVHRSIDTTSTQDAARGLGIAPSFGAAQGSTFANTAGNAIASQITSAGARAPRLWPISRTQVAGLSFVGTSSALYFVERSSGNVLRADPSNSAIVRITNTTLPKIYAAMFSGENVFLRSVDGAEGVTTYAGVIKAATSTGEVGTLDGVYLPQNILSLAIRKNQLFFLLQSPSGGALGVTADFKGQNQKRILSSNLSQWRIYGTPDGGLFMAQKAADDISGYSFSVGNDGSLSPLISGVPGLVILPRASSTALLWSSSQSGSLNLFGTTAANATPVKLPVRTTAEKCVWAPGQALIAYCAAPRSTSSTSFLTNWYSGVLHSSDSWWRIDLSAGTAEQFFSPSASVTIDVIDPAIDQSGSYIAFRNAIDNTPWMLRIAE